MERFSSSFFQNRDCEYFPCHKGVPEDAFNCLFCYCPLYMLCEDCGGNFVYLSNGIKSCEGCTLPHGTGGYAHVMERYALVAQRVRRKPEEEK